MSPTTGLGVLRDIHNQPSTLLLLPHCDNIIRLK